MFLLSASSKSVEEITTPGISIESEAVVKCDLAMKHPRY